MKMANNVIMKAWKEFAAATMPADPAANQEKEMRRAFFAGAFSAFTMLMKATDDVSVEEGAMIFDGYLNECKAFFEGIKAGKY